MLSSSVFLLLSFLLPSFSIKINEIHRPLVQKTTRSPRIHHYRTTTRSQDGRHSCDIQTSVLWHQSLFQLFAEQPAEPDQCLGLTTRNLSYFLLSRTAWNRYWSNAEDLKQSCVIKSKFIKIEQDGGTYNQEGSKYFWIKQNYKTHI